MALGGWWPSGGPSPEGPAPRGSHPRDLQFDQDVINIPQKSELLLKIMHLMDGKHIFAILKKMFIEIWG